MGEGKGDASARRYRDRVCRLRCRGRGSDIVLICYWLWGRGRGRGIDNALRSLRQPSQPTDQPSLSPPSRVCSPPFPYFHPLSSPSSNKRNQPALRLPTTAPNASATTLSSCSDLRLATSKNGKGLEISFSPSILPNPTSSSPSSSSVTSPSSSGLPGPPLSCGWLPG
ncbi:hypothetical protein KC362_g60 [Hortaea werneckii]|nr:hypothetical protein KC362_g60 [Hortaea werneckii]